MMTWDVRRKTPEARFDCDDCDFMLVVRYPGQNENEEMSLITWSRCQELANEHILWNHTDGSIYADVVTGKALVWDTR